MARGQAARFAAGARTTAFVVGALALLVGGCEPEKRRVGPAPPSSPPTQPADARASLYETNRYELSEGGRLFRWAGCDACHAEGAPGFANLADTAWRQGGSTADIYRAIAHGAPGMPPYAARLTPQQTWQVAGYVGGLHRIKPNVRVRNANAQSGEPSGSTWTGPLS